MKFALALFLAAPLQACGSALPPSPIAKVIGMLSELQAKVTKEGEVAHEEFAAFSEWCEDRNRNLDFEIKTGSMQVEELKASIAQEGSLAMSIAARIEELVAGLAAAEGDLKAATEIRNHEANDFVAEEKELVETVDILHRAIRIIEREIRSGASMLQLNRAGSIVQALSVMVKAAMIDTSDVSKLTAFVQATQKEEEQEEDGFEQLGAPAADVYKSHSGDIVDTLQDLLDKAENQVETLRRRETSSTHNFEMLKQSLEDEIAVANKEMAAAKKGSAGSTERKATAEGDLKVTSKELASDIDVKGGLHQTCMTRAQVFEAETKSRGDELKTLAQAKQVIQEATDLASFLQVDRLSTTVASSMHLANLEAVRMVRDLARKQHSRMLAQLATRMASAMRSTSAEPFLKVKGLITEMIATLEAEAGQDATKKAYCSKELSETNTKKVEKTTEIQMLTSRADQASAKSAKLKAEVSILQHELAELVGAQAKMDQMRRQEAETYAMSKAEQEKGLEGIKLAMSILREYYASDAVHNAAVGAAKGIIGLLETVESDMTKTLAALMTEEETAAAEYDRMSKDNEIERTTKEQDVSYKVKESKQLDKTTSENTADRSAVQAELDALMEYLSKIQEQCIAKAEAYSDRANRREAEIAGLKQALDVLESETAFLQRWDGHRKLRGGFLRAHK